MSIPDLKSLCRTELYECADRIKERLKEIDDEEKIVIWQVEGRYEIYGYFREEDYLNALAFLVERAKLLHQENQPNKFKALSLTARLYPESECPELSL